MRSILVFGAPSADHSGLDRALPEFSKLFVASNARPAVTVDEYLRTESDSVLLWGGATVKSLRKLNLEVDPPGVISCFPGPCPLVVGGERYDTFVLDWGGNYINPRRPSDLEVILNLLDFGAHPALERLGKTLRPLAFPASSPDGGAVTVIIQDRSDPSFVYAPPSHPSAAQMIAMAQAENPGCHLDVVLAASADRRPILSGSLPSGVAVIPPEFETAILARSRRIYTVNSPLAVGAVMRGASVVVFGQPFYAGYGLTDDRMAIPRRPRPLDRDRMFSGLFGLYCRLVDRTGALVTLETVCDRLERASEG